ncbi:sensor histidine kinase [Paenibacillus nuruki]|uniref:sensor histidine kinase n=1 Tax=Paenibacillus nuruki TaxID=1886670 RepID=UPI002804A37E|nr:sensor histidine kinase [Paenibacillus nuruki]CAJ1314170.1 Histidine kinase [Paenibacillus nuruki]
MKGWAFVRPAWQRLILYTVVMGIVALLLFAIQWFAVHEYQLQITEINESHLQDIVQATSTNMNNQYQTWQVELNELAATIGKNILDNSKRAYTSGITRNPGEFYVLTNQYEIIGGRNNTIMQSAVQQVQTLQNGCGITGFTTENNQPVQYMICRIKGTDQNGFAVRAIDTSMLSQRIIADSTHYETLIYNEEFKVVGSHNATDIGRVDITAVTKKLLDGNTGIIEDNHIKYGIGFSRINDDHALYVAVHEINNDTAQNVKAFRNQMVLIYIPVFLIAAIVMVFYRRRVIKDNTVNTQVRDQRREEDLRQQQDTYYLPMLQSMEEQLQELQNRTTRLTGGDDLKLLGFYNNLADNLEASASRGDSASRAELEFFRELNQNFTQGRLKQESYIAELAVSVQELREELEQKMHGAAGINFTDMNEVITESLKWANRALDMKGIEVVVKQEPVSPIAAQSAMLYRTIQGLVENAVVAMAQHYEAPPDMSEHGAFAPRSKRVNKTLKVSSLMDEEEILITIEDTGGGIDDKMRWNYFQSDYSQNNNADTLSLYHMDAFLKTIGGRLKLRNTDRGLQAIIQLRR